MAYTITSQCIRCDRCLSVCPTGAIQRNGQLYWINPAACNNCVSQYGVPQCWAACPTNAGCLPFMSGTTAVKVAQPAQDPEYWDSWFATYNILVARLKTTKQSKYWQWWFDAYSQALAKQTQPLGTA